MGHIHVRDKSTGHEYPVSDRLFNPEVHQKTGKPARDAHGDLVAVKYRTPLGVSLKPDAKKSSTKEAVAPTAESGQKAETEKE